jgi:hypothetical protein
MPKPRYHRHRPNSIAYPQRHSAPRVLATLCEVVRDMYRQLIGTPWCIEASRLVTFVAPRFNLSAVPIEVTTIVANAAMVHRLGILSPLPVYKWQRPKMYGIGLGADDRHHPKGMFNGHVVALVNDTFIVDLAVAQLREPALGISTPDVWATRAPELRDEEGEVATVFSDHGPATMLVYKRRPACVDHTASPHWNAREARIMSLEVTKHMKTRLQHGHQPASVLLAELQPGSADESATDWQHITSRLILDHAQRLARQGGIV